MGVPRYSIGLLNINWQWHFVVVVLVVVVVVVVSGIQPMKNSK